MKKRQSSIHKEVYFQLPHPFRHQPLPIALQKKNKQIKKTQKQLDECNRLYQITKQRWELASINFQIEKQRKLKEYLLLKEEAEKQKQQKLKWELRRDRLNAISSKQIKINYGLTIKKYLKSSTFTIGNKYESIKYIGDQMCRIEKMIKLSDQDMLQENEIKFQKIFLANLSNGNQRKHQKIRNRCKMAIDYCFNRQNWREKIQSIRENLDKIVYLKKYVQRTIKNGFLQTQSIMFCIKQLNKKKINENVIPKKSRKQIYPQLFKPENTVEINEKEVMYQFMIYSISGQYFCYKKCYTERYLLDTISKIINRQIETDQNISTSKEQQFKTPLIIQKRKSHRPSVNDTIMKNKLMEIHMNIAREQNNLPFQNNNHPSPNNDSLSESDLSKKNIQSPKNIKGKERVRILQRISQNHSSSQIDSQSKINSIAELSDSIKNSQNSSFVRSEENQVNSQSESESQITQSIDPSKSSFHLTFKTYSKNTYSNKSSKNILPQFFLKGQAHILFPLDFPLKNIMIIKKLKAIYILQEYFEIPEKHALVNISLKKFQLKVYLQKQLKKVIVYKALKINCFYENTINLIQQPKQIFVLFTIKKDTESGNILISCENIKSYEEPYVFTIKEIFVKKISQIQKMNQNLLHNNLVHRRKGANSRDLKKNSFSRKSKDLKNVKNSIEIDEKNKNRLDQIFIQEMKQKFEKFLQTTQICLAEKKFVKIISYPLFENQIIKIQSQIKRAIYQKRYKLIQKQSFKYLYNAEKKWLFSCFNQNELGNIKTFIENVDINVQKQNRIRTLNFSDKYWVITENIIDELQLNEEQIQKNYLNIRQLFKNSIQKYQQNIIKKQAEKPLRYRAAIKRFTLKLFFRMKAKQNIFYLKIIQIKNQGFVLIIRKSNFFSKVFECNLYQLLPNLNNQIENKKNTINLSAIKQCNEILEYSKKSKSSKQVPSFRCKKSYRFQTIYLLENYFENIDSKLIYQEFYIDKKIFLLKPKKKQKYNFIDRLNSIDINSEEIQREIINFQREEAIKGSQMMIARSSKKLNLIQPHKILKNRQNAILKRGRISIQKNDVSNLMMNIFSSNTQKASQQLHLKAMNKGEVQNKIKSSQNSSHKHEKGSKLSIPETNSHKGVKHYYTIVNNHHQGILYYSLLKSQEIFFYLDLYIVFKKQIQNQKNYQKIHNQSYSEELFKIHRIKIYKKQLLQSSTGLIYSKIASWFRQNEQEMIETISMSDKQKREREMNLIQSKVDLNTISEFEGPDFLTIDFFKCLINSNKRYSFGADNENNGERQNNGRNSTLTNK